MALIRTADGVGAVRLINAKTKSAFRLDQNILLPHAEPNGGRCRISQHRAHRRSEKENPVTAGAVVTGCRVAPGSPMLLFKLNQKRIGSPRAEPHQW
jgi:hypothetical protein